MASALKAGGGLLLGLGNRRDEDQRAGRFGMLDRDRQRQRPAERMADDQRFLEAQRRDEGRDRLRLREEAGRSAGAARRIAGAGAVDQDDAVVPRQIVHEARGEALHHRAEAVDQQDRRTGAALDIMEAVAVDVDEAARGRHGVLGLARRGSAERGEPGAD